MKERPINFTAKQVRAVLDGSKTQHRVPVVLNGGTVLTPAQRRIGFAYRVDHARVGDAGAVMAALAGVEPLGVSQQISVPIRHPNDAGCPWEECGYTRIYCPLGGPGERLWVREKWMYAGFSDEGVPTIGYFCGGEELQKLPSEKWVDRVHEVWADLSVPGNYKIHNRACDQKFRSSLSMPRWASRITLEITGVRVERAANGREWIIDSKRVEP